MGRLAITVYIYIYSWGMLRMLRFEIAWSCVLNTLIDLPKATLVVFETPTKNDMNSGIFPWKLPSLEPENSSSKQEKHLQYSPIFVGSRRRRSSSPSRSRRRHWGVEIVWKTANTWWVFNKYPIISWRPSPLKTNMASWIFLLVVDRSANRWFSMVMLVFRGVIPSYLYHNMPYIVIVHSECEENCNFLAKYNLSTTR